MENNIIVKHIPKPVLLEQAAEECNELSHACLKMARKMRGENPTPKTMEEIRADITEEIADVLLCIEYLDDAGIFDSHAIEGIMTEKQMRWIRRLEAEGKS